MTFPNNRSIPNPTKLSRDKPTIKFFVYAQKGRLLCTCVSITVKTRHKPEREAIACLYARFASGMPWKRYCFFYLFLRGNKQNLRQVPFKAALKPIRTVQIHFKAALMPIRTVRIHFKIALMPICTVRIHFKVALMPIRTVRIHFKATLMPICTIRFQFRIALRHIPVAGGCIHLA